VQKTKSRWAYADSTSTNRNDGIARVGSNPDGSGLYRSYFEFDLTQVAQTHIQAATFGISMTHSYSCGSTPVSLYASNGIDPGVSGSRTSWNLNGLGAWLDTQWGHAHKPSGGAGCVDDPQRDMSMSFSNQLYLNLQSWAN